MRLRGMFAEIFSDEFMAEHTNFDNFDGFKFSSAVIVNWEAETLVYSKTLLDNFVKESTRFSSWEEMIQTATDKRFME